MKKFIFLSFLFLGWAFYELSGGADFDPGTASRPALPPQKKGVAAVETPAEPAAAPRQKPDTPSAELASLTAPAAIPAVTAAPASLPRPAAPAPVTTAAADTAQPSGVQSPIAGGNELTPVSSPFAAQPAPADTPAQENPLQPVAIPQILAQDFREVTGNRVNMRAGPGTQFGVLDTLTRGDVVEVLSEEVNGWAKLRVVETRRVGWMSSRLLSTRAFD